MSKGGKASGKKKNLLKIVPVITKIFTKINIDASEPLAITLPGNRCSSLYYACHQDIQVLFLWLVLAQQLLWMCYYRFSAEWSSWENYKQDRSFTSALTTEFSERFGVKVVRSSVYHLQSNPVENIHKTLKRIFIMSWSTSRLGGNSSSSSICPTNSYAWQY